MGNIVDLSQYLWPAASQGRPPSEALRVNANHPAYDGLQALIVPNGGVLVDVLNSSRPSADTSSVKISPSGGAARAYSGTKNTQFKNRAQYGSGNAAMTIVVIFDINTLSNYSHLASCQNTTMQSGWEFRCGDTATSGKLAFGRMTAGGNYQFFVSDRSTDHVSANSTNNFVAVTCADGNISTAPIYNVNGVKYAGYNYGGTGSGPQGASTGALWLGRRYDSACQLDGNIKFVGIWNKALTWAVQEELRSNPWRLIDVPADIPVMVSAGGGAQSYSYSATGGMVLAGTSAELRARTVVPSGGTVLAGTAAEARGVVKSTSGGIVAGGSAAQIRGAVRSPSGGLTLGGVSSALRGLVKSATGGLIFGGAASVSFTSAVQSRVVNAVGGMILAGAAGVQRTVTASLTAGGLLFGGSAGAYIGGQIGNWLQLARRRGNR